VEGFSAETTRFSNFKPLQKPFYHCTYLVLLEPLLFHRLLEPIETQRLVEPESALVPQRPPGARIPPSAAIASDWRQPSRAARPRKPRERTARGRPSESAALRARW
jgi:hypothetical protein